MTGEVRVYLATTLEQAQEAVRKLNIVATVEAECGDSVVKGRKVTLAHHGSRSGNPAPCNTIVSPLNGSGDILISHIDLDTMGGIMALLGQKPRDPEFWAAAEYIDVHGPHHLHELTDTVQDKLNAYYAFNAAQYYTRYTGVADVTHTVIDYGRAIVKIVHGDREMIEAGRRWAEKTKAEIEACLLYEDECVRVFKGDVFCSSSYYSPARQTVVPSIVSYNIRNNAITVSFAEPSSHLSARRLAQALWGLEAGGRDGIAGSPRGAIMTDADLSNAAYATRDLVRYPALSVDATADFWRNAGDEWAKIWEKD